MTNPYRKDFKALDQLIHGRPLAYLDNGATTLKPECVALRLRDFYLYESANIHRGLHTLSEKATTHYENVREKVQHFIKAPSSNEIIFTKGTTEAFNLLASSLGPLVLDGESSVMISEMEHHANIVPWQLLQSKIPFTLKVIKINDRGEIDWEDFLTKLTKDVKILSLVMISNSLGTVNPVDKIIQVAKEKFPHIITILDGAQMVAHRPIDVKKLDCDFLCFSSHKIYGPTGVGVLYGKKKYLDQMPPYQGGGDMIESVTFEKTTFNQAPSKFEAGTPAIGETIALGTALDYVLKVGHDFIYQEEKKLLHYGHQVLSEVPGLRFIGTAEDKSCILSFVIDGIHPHDVGTICDEYGVAIRTGHHCTQPVMKRFKVPATNRASLSFYNSESDLDQLKEALLGAQRIFNAAK
jgi:cysteine desulfurase/selenocysteine lyase